MEVSLIELVLNPDQIDEVGLDRGDRIIHALLEDWDE
jgi:hypothetical protein